MQGMNVSDDSSGDEYGNGMALTKDVHPSVRMGFIKKVYGILGAQLLLTFLIALPIRVYMDPYTIAANFGTFKFIMYMPLIMLISVQCCCQEMMRQVPHNYIFLLVFTVFEAITVGVITVFYKAESVIFVAAVTAVLVIALSVYAAVTKQDFTGCWPYLMGATLALMSFSMVLMIWQMFGGIVPPFLHLVYSALATVLFCFYLVYDTQMIVGEAPMFGFGGHHRDYGYTIDDYCFAALNLYLDIIGLFLNLLALFGDRR